MRRGRGDELFLAADTEAALNILDPGRVRRGRRRFFRTWGEVSRAIPGRTG